MKTMKFIAHPLTTVISFLVILISGEQFGSFYIFYLLLGLPHGTAHSITGVLGIAFVLFGKVISKQLSRNFTALVNVIGCLLLWSSLCLFFFTDKSNYNIATFYQLLPLILMIIFLLISISFFVENILLLLKHSKNNFYKPTASK